MIVLGLGFTDHDTSAALVVDGQLKTAIARERLTRLKHDGRKFGSKTFGLDLPIQYCLDQNGLTLSDVDLVAWNQVDHISPKQLTIQLVLEGAQTFSGIPLLVLPHHFAHACTAFYLSPFSEAAVLIADGSGGLLDGLARDCEGPEVESIRKGEATIQNFLGERTENARELESFYHCDGKRWKILRKVVGDNDGIGARYGAITSILFGNLLDAGKTMGLAPYGRPEEAPLFMEPRGPDEMRAFQGIHGSEWDQLKRQMKAWRSAGPKLNYEDPLPSNFSASMQSQAEEAMLTHARWLREATGAKNLCIAGGVALNCVANSYIAREAGFAEVFVPPAPADDGIAVGCALHGAAAHGELSRGQCAVFLGRSYSHSPDELKSLGLTPISPDPNATDWLAKKIAEGAVVGWYQGGTELGPRALGHRSFLADARRHDMRDHLNLVVKNRESFRPFAPVVLEDAVLEYFEEHHPSYFMSFVSPVRKEKRAVVPAIIHVDGTSRYQVLRKVDNPELYELIVAFAKQTGVPLLLNTSFNRAGEPIVETPMEAARCTLAASADYLVLDGIIYGRC
jgi:carbamoyltransferase